jgi:hypothetical protein
MARSTGTQDDTIALAAAKTVARIAAKRKCGTRSRISLTLNPGYGRRRHDCLGRGKGV